MEEHILALFKQQLHRRLTDDEQRILNTWLEADEENRTLFEQWMRLYKTELRWHTLHHTDAQAAWQQIKRRRQLKRQQRLWWTVVAACIVIALGLAGPFFLSTPSSRVEEGKLTELFPQENLHEVVLTTTRGERISIDRHSVLQTPDGQAMASVADHTLSYQTLPAQTAEEHTLFVPQGKTFTVVLPDGSKVWLNSETSLTYPLSFGDTRRVALQGEAYFEVIHNTLPFEVVTSAGRVSVLGTSFNLATYGHRRMQTTLVEGSVRVDNGSTSRLLKPGQQADTEAHSNVVSVKEVNTALFTSWRTGLFEFRDTSLADIMQLFTRWYGVEVHYADPALQHIRLGGNLFKNRSLGYSLELIERVADVHFLKQGTAIKVVNATHNESEIMNP